MDNIITDHDHSLSVLWDNTQRKLADITPLWEQAGQAWMAALSTGMAAGVNYSPLTGYDPSTFVNPFATAQHGMEYVPRTMPAMLHKGESVLPAAEAAQYRQGGDITINLTLGGGYSPYQGQQIAAQIATELGRGIRRSYR